MSLLMDSQHDLLEQRRSQGNVLASDELDHAIGGGPQASVRARVDLILNGHQRMVALLGLAKALDEVEPGSGQREDSGVIGCVAA